MNNSIQTSLRENRQEDSRSSSDTPPNSFIDLITSLKVKITEGDWIGVPSLIHSTLGVDGCVGVLRWGLGWMISKSTIYIDLYKPNNKLVDV